MPCTRVGHTLAQEPLVLACCRGDLLTLLSLRTGRYHTFNALAAFIWEQLARPTDFADLARAIRGSFAVQDADVEADLATVIAEMQAHGLIIDTSAHRISPATIASAQRPVTSFSRVMVVVTLIGVRLLLQTRGLLHAARFALAVDVVPARVDEERVRRLVAHVNSVATLVPFRAECLERSLVVAAILRRLGADAKVRLAVRHFPFEAHAWAEVDGRPVNETEAVCALFQPLPALDLETLACSR